MNEPNQGISGDPAHEAKPSLPRSPTLLLLGFASTLLMTFALLCAALYWLLSAGGFLGRGEQSPAQIFNSLVVALAREDWSKAPPKDLAKDLKRWLDGQADIERLLFNGEVVELYISLDQGAVAPLVSRPSIIALVDRRREGEAEDLALPTRLGSLKVSRQSWSTAGEQGRQWFESHSVRIPILPEGERRGVLIVKMSLRVSKTSKEGR